MRVIEADPHNFGRTVELGFGRRGQLVYKKPRPLFWEWLFFGMDSPLRSALSTETCFGGPGSHGPYHTSIAQAVLGLSVHFEDVDTRGHSEAVHAVARNSHRSEHDLLRFGLLLGYCYAFGIQDLFRDNVMLTDERIQVIDAEVVLSSLLVPSETLLLPFHITPFAKSGISHLALEPAALTVADIKSILTGFVASLQTMKDNSVKLLNAVNNALAERPLIPVRVILRDTLRYRAWRDEKPERPFFSEELTQLERGDIPYFFKFVGQSDLYYYTSEARESLPVSVPEDFQKKVARVGCQPSHLLDPRRIEEQLIPTGTLSILRSLLPPQWQGQLSLGTVSISATATDITARTSSGIFSARRHRIA